VGGTVKEVGVIRLPKAVLNAAIGHVVLCDAFHRVVARIEPGVRGDRAKLANLAIDD
jgi:hypothetical protein